MQLLQDIEQRSKSFVNITACIERARNEMAEPTPNYDHTYNKLYVNILLLYVINLHIH